MCSELRLKLLGTRLPPRKLLDIRKDVPTHIDNSLIVDLLNGEIEHIQSGVFEYLHQICDDYIKLRKPMEADKTANVEKRKQKVREWRKRHAPIPPIHRDKSRDDYVDIPREKRERIEKEIKRTNFSVQKLLRAHDIDGHQIAQITRGVQKTALIKDVDRVIALHESMPTVIRYLQLKSPETALDLISPDVRSNIKYSPS